MNPKTEGKIMIALIISLIAFGCGSGAGILMSISQDNNIPPMSLNFTKQEIPSYHINPNANDTGATQKVQPSSTNGSEEVYVENPTNTQQNQSL